MNSPALSRGIRKGLRTIAQVAAGGALTALVTALAGGLDPATQGLVMGAWVALVAFLQNWAETAGKVPTFLPSPGQVVSPTDVVVATVETVTDATGGIVGDVSDLAGDVIGTVTGQTDDHHEAGRVAVVVLVVVAALVLTFVACDAIFDDEDEVDDLGQGIELVADGDDNRGGRNKNGRDCEGSQDCSTLSPSFEDSPVYVCLPGSTCHF